MEVRHAYDEWANQYDTNKNRTRDMEANAIRKLLHAKSFSTAVEIGCGTGKNTVWLQEVCTSLVAVDFSEGMLAEARRKVSAGHVKFYHADVKQSWTFVRDPADLITFSLVLEHIEDIVSVLHEAAAHLTPGGYLYIGELHPFKQYLGTRARFESAEGTKVVECHTHHVSDFVDAALSAGLYLEKMEEFFDPQTEVPRILALLFRKK